MKAIETTYRGYRFRSRLEARWAVFFDAIGIEWQYEPEGFERWIGSDGNRDQHVSYLPDFFLPKSQTWVEVKGSDDYLRAESGKLTEMLSLGSPLPGVDESFHHDSTCGLLILGDIPQDKWGITFHMLVQQSVDLYRRWAFFSPESLFVAPLQTDLVHNLCGVPKTEIIFEREQWTTKPIQIETKRSWNKVVDAYESARQARFEHGQHGAPSSWRCAT